MNELGPMIGMGVLLLAAVVTHAVAWVKLSNLQRDVGGLWFSHKMLLRSVTDALERLPKSRARKPKAPKDGAA